jgi:hypothetical protein
VTVRDIRRLGGSVSKEADWQRRHPAAPPAIHVHVGELVLDEACAGDRHRIGDAIGLELTRLLADQPVAEGLSPDRSVSRIDAGVVRPGPPGQSARLASAIARAVHGALARP